MSTDPQSSNVAKAALEKMAQPIPGLDLEKSPPSPAADLKGSPAPAKPARKPRARKPVAPRKKRASGKFAVFSAAKVAAGEGQLVDVLVPESPVFASSREAEQAARELAGTRDGVRLSVHRILAAFTVQSVTKRTLVRD